MYSFYFQLETPCHRTRSQRQEYKDQFYRADISDDEGAHGHVVEDARPLLLPHPVQPPDHLLGRCVHPVALASLDEVVEVLPVPGIYTYEPLVPLQAVVGLEALATALAHRDMATMLTTLVLV